MIPGYSIIEVHKGFEIIERTPGKTKASVYVYGLTEIINKVPYLTKQPGSREAAILQAKNWIDKELKT